MMLRPPIVSYAQNFEDVLLDRIFRDQPTGFYIDIGAWHPVLDSVTKHFADKGWRGVNVEPVKADFDRFVEARPRDINLNVAVGAAEGRAPFVEVAGTGWSSLGLRVDRQTIAAAGYTAREIEVPVTTLAAITDRHVTRPVDFLKIDVEGFEGDVIAGGEWRACRPRVLVIEAIDPETWEPSWDEWEGMVLERGYEFGLFDGINRFYFRREEPELRRFFRAPANRLDSFMTYGEKCLIDEVVRLRAAVQAPA